MIKTIIKVQDVMLEPDLFPIMPATTLFKIALEEMGSFRLGIACLVDEDSILLGILTDGDVRRRLLADQRPSSALFVDDSIEHAITDPITILPDANLIQAVELMEKYQIWDLPVVNSSGKLFGLLHLHAAIKSLLQVSF